MEEVQIDVPEGASREEIAAAIDEKLQSQGPRPDEILLSRVIQMLENNIGEVQFEDLITRDGATIIVGDKPVLMFELEARMQIADKDRPYDDEGQLDMDAFFTKFFEPVALGFKNMIEDEGYNVCRPIGILDNDLTARQGILQLCLAGEKTSIYMCHKYHDTDAAYTDLLFKILVGKR